MRDDKVAMERRFVEVGAVPDRERELISEAGVLLAANRRAMSPSLGLIPIKMSVLSPQSNGMAQRFVWRHASSG